MQRQIPGAVALLLVGLVACGDNGMTGSGDADVVDLTGDGFAVVDAEDAFANIEDATLEAEMRMSAALEDPEEFARHRMHPRRHGSHLGPILIRLHLDEQQRLDVLGAVMDHREAVRGVLAGLRAANADLIAAANEERATVLQSLAAGRITRDEARSMLAQISRRTREAIRSNPENEPYLQALCDARLALFETIRSILREDQQVTWDAWVAGLARDCTNG